MRSLKKAIEFAEKAHGEQKRKYTGAPYVTHPIAVAGIVAENVPHATHEQLTAAILHDVLEDTDVPAKEIRYHFGPVVLSYVKWLSDVSKPEDGNRATRKSIDRKHIAKAPSEVKTIKLADLIDNTVSIVERDPKFAKTYMAEKALLLKVLKEGDAVLYKIAKKQVEDFYK